VIEETIVDRGFEPGKVDATGQGLQAFQLKENHSDIETDHSQTCPHHVDCNFDVWNFQDDSGVG
jgi:hypothetical protein